MSEQTEPTESAYPLGRGYGHDYMRGGEVLGGYGYSAREEYERSRGELELDGRREPADGALRPDHGSEPPVS